MNTTVLFPLNASLTNMKKVVGKAAAVAAGKCICAAAERVTNILPGPENEKARAQARGACIYAMDNLWYDAMTMPARDSFHNTRERFYAECGWPD